MVLNFNQIRVTLLVIVVLVLALCVANQCRANDKQTADKCFAASFLTFKYSSDKNKIVLNNLKLNYINRGDPDETISAKDIHIEEQIILGDITEQRLIQIINSNNLSTEYDNQILCTDTAQIDGRRFIGVSTEKDGFYIIDEHNRRIFSDTSLECTWFAFEDFDNDGYLDIKFRYVGNTPVEELLLFDKKCGNFRKVEGFIDYPECTNILDTKYYYSYHRSGCADYNWDSDLFYIENYRAIHLGNISGIGCVDSGVELGVFINKIKGQCKTIIKKLPIEIIEEYENWKWGFIEDYWKKNYRLFDDGIN